jgi:hypothetical protein
MALNPFYIVEASGGPYKTIKEGIIMSRKGVVQTRTNEKKWTGVTGDIVLPDITNVYDGYIDFYLGIGTGVLEAGLSKTPQGYKIFINGGPNHNESHYTDELGFNIYDGERHNLKLS